MYDRNELVAELCWNNKGFYDPIAAEVSAIIKVLKVASLMKLKTIRLERCSKLLIINNFDCVFKYKKILSECNFFNLESDNNYEIL